MRPTDTEYAPFYASYIARVPEINPLPALEAQPAEIQALADRITPEDELYRYALGKWSVRQVVSHIIDTERVMGYRAFCIARGEVKPLPGFDEGAYVAHADADERPPSRRALRPGVEPLDEIQELTDLCLVGGVDRDLGAQPRVALPQREGGVEMTRGEERKGVHGHPWYGTCMILIP